MKLYSLLLLCGFVAFSQSEVLKKSSRLEIRNGENATDGEFPYIVELRDGNGCFFCAGTILSSKWILTAAHCVAGGDINSIVYGTIFLHDCTDNNTDPDTVIKVKTLYRHPSSAEIVIPTNDVGLIELEEDIPFGDYAQPITLTDVNKNPSDGVIGNLTGWGKSAAEEVSYIEKLQKIKLSILPNEECATRIDNKYSGVTFNGTEFFCTNDDDNGMCFGDSGGPFVVDGIQYGIVSWSLKPCGDYPGVYTRIALPEHRQWIKNVTGI